MRNLFLIIIIAPFILSSCLIKGAFDVPEAWDWGWRPRPYLLRGVPDKDDDYTEGFRDGCSTALASVAQGLVRSNNAPRHDGWKMTSNPLYAAGFVDGDEHCTYIYDWEII